MSLFARSFLKWLPIAVGCTLVLGISYVFVQQSYRMGANDPQTMVAHDTAAALAAGSQPDQLVSNETIDPSVSLAPFVIVFDAAGKPLSVREALALINQTLDEALAEQEGDFDADTRWALAWFEGSGFSEGEYGVAETLSKAKNTSVAGMVEAGILASRHGKVRLLRKSSKRPENVMPL